MNHLRADIKYATRSLWNARGFSLVAVLTLAIGIGANAGMFSLVNAVILRPLPYEDPERLVAVRTANPVRGVDSMDSSPPDYFDWRDQSDSFEELAAYWSPELNLTGNGEPERLLGAVVTWTLFDVFAVRSQLGRLFTEDEDSPGGEPVALISDGLWRRRFGADRSVIGRSITLNEVPRTIVGVLVPGFEFPLEGTEVWIPGRYSPTDPSNPTFEAADYRSFRILGVVGRLGSGVSIDEVRADLGTVAARLEGEYPESNDGYTVRVLGLHEHTVGSLRPGLLLLLGAVSCLLLIASVNVAGMILARGADRRREIAIRVAMGANARRVVGQLLVESSILALVGGILGCVGAYLVIPIMTVLAPASLPMSEAVRVDATVVFYAFGVTALTGVLFGLFPALYAATPDLAGALRQTANRLTTSARSLSGIGSLEARINNLRAIPGL